MSAIDDVTDAARDLPPEAVGVLGALAALFLILAVTVRLQLRRMRSDLRRAEEELVDRATGLLPRSALRVRLGAELAWAANSGTPLAVAAMRIRGSRFRHAAQVLRHSMREEESAFLLGDQQVAIELWGADQRDAAAATRRLALDLAQAGHPVVDAGLACAPRDGNDVETLVAAARRDQRPVDDPREPGGDLDRDGYPRSAVAWTMRALGGALVWFGAMLVLLVAAWRLLPVALEPGGSLEQLTGRDLGAGLSVLVGVPVAAALLLVAAWNVGSGGAPRSRPLWSAGVRTCFAVFAVVGIPLALDLFDALRVPFLDGGVPATLALLTLALLAIFHARQLVHVPAPLLVVLVVAGAALTWLAVDLAQWPLVANGGRLLVAAAFGALLAGLVDRASWIVGLGLFAGAIDAWSVFAEGGITNQLLDSGEDSARLLVDLLLFTGPSVDGTALFAVGVTDLVFLAFFLSWAHDWRLDLRVVGAAMLLATWGGVLVGEALDAIVPLLPFLCGAMVLVVVLRSVLLRARVSAWRHFVAGEE